MVELIKFSIKNFKSIKDTGICYLDKNVTVLAGKNEAGKTTILEALECLNSTKKIPENAIPKSHEKDKLMPEIRITLRLNNSEWAKLFEASAVSAIFEPIQIDIVKRYPDMYSFEIVHEDEQVEDADLKSMLNSLIATNAFNSIIPNFILFKTFEDSILPHQIPLTQIENFPLVKDLEKLSDLDPALLQAGADPGEKEIHRRKINLKLTKDYGAFWSQDAAMLSFTLDSNNIYFWFDEGTQLYKPEERSKGRQWHLTFYIKMTARSLEDKPNIILIDEPGLFLHARAQRDILKNLEECASRHQIVFSTHSPYLIERNKLDRVRLIIKGDGGTKIKKITATADKETLTPILTAIGDDLASGIRVDRPNSIVLEGFTDYLWLNAFRKILGMDETIEFIPCVGANGEINVGSILFGWGLEPKFLLDNDREGIEVKQKLIEKLSIPEDKIYFVSHKSNTVIEDLFSDEDRKNYANINKESKSKFILATQFYNSVKAGDITASNLEDITLENFEKLLKSLVNDTHS